MQKIILIVCMCFNYALSFCQAVDTIFVTDSTYSTGFLIDSRKHGEWKSYSNYILAERIFFSNGNRDGEALKFYKNGIVKIRAFYIDGVLNGNVLFYSENGVLIANYNYDNGFFEGKWLYVADENAPPTFKTYSPKFSLK